MLQAFVNLGLEFRDNDWLPAINVRQSRGWTRFLQPFLEAGWEPFLCAELRWTTLMISWYIYTAQTIPVGSLCCKGAVVGRRAGAQPHHIL